MTKTRMTRENEHEFYAQPENQEPQGPARRRKLSTPPDIAKGERPDERADRGADSADRTDTHEA